jgi:hypothetical protein
LLFAFGGGSSPLADHQGTHAPHVVIAFLPHPQLDRHKYDHVRAKAFQRHKYKYQQLPIIKNAEIRCMLGIGNTPSLLDGLSLIQLI